MTGVMCAVCVYCVCLCLLPRGKPVVYFTLSDVKGGCAATAVLNLLLYRKQRHLIRQGNIYVHIIFADEGPQWLQDFYNDNIYRIVKGLHLRDQGSCAYFVQKYLKQYGNVRYCKTVRMRRHLRNGEPVIVVEPCHLVLMLKINGRFHRLDRWNRYSQGISTLCWKGKENRGIHYIEN